MNRVFVIDDEAAMGENVQRMLRAPGLVVARGPEAGGVRGQHLVHENERVARQAKLELGVGQDDATCLGDVARAAIEGQAQSAKPLRQIAAQVSDHPVEGNVLVVRPHFFFCGGGKDRLIQPVGFHQALG